MIEEKRTDPQSVQVIFTIDGKKFASCVVNDVNKYLKSDSN